MQVVSHEIGQAFSALGLDLLAVYQGSPDDPQHRLAEALVEWDERISLWRVRHFKLITRIIGFDVVGTKGTPVVEILNRLLAHRLFPELWRVRTELTLRGPLSDP